MRRLLAFICFFSLFASEKKHKFEKSHLLLSAVLATPKSRSDRSPDLLNALKIRDRNEYRKQEQEKNRIENVFFFK